MNRNADTVLLTERLHVYDNAANYPGNVLMWGPGAFVSGVNWWDGSGSPSLLPDGTRAPKPKTDPTGPNGCIRLLSAGRSPARLFCTIREVTYSILSPRR